VWGGENVRENNNCFGKVLISLKKLVFVNKNKPNAEVNSSKVCVPIS
jgi:hypothetical protein